MNAKIMVDSTEHLTANRMYTDGTNNDFDGTRHFFASSTFEIGPDSEKDIAFKAVYIVDNEDRDAAADVDKIDVVPWLAHVESSIGFHHGNHTVSDFCFMTGTQGAQCSVFSSKQIHG